MVKYILSSFCLAFFLFPAFISFLEKTRILDVPDKRKIHAIHTPSMGGVPMFISVAFALYLWYPEPLLEFKFLIAALILMFSVGLRDDLVPLPASLKLASQLIPFLLLINWGGFRLNSFYELAPAIEFHPVLIWLISIFVFIVITNSINLIDGLDGLAGSIGLIIFISYGTWFMIAGFEEAGYFCFAVVGAITAFLFFNWQPSRIFMGDTGALTLGLMSAAFTILFINYNFNLDPSNPAFLSTGVATAICIMIIPLTDTLRVFIIRILAGRSPFSADTNHLHHMLIQCGMTHSGAVKILASVNLMFIGLAFVGRSWSPRILLLCAVLMAISGVILLTLAVRLRLKTKPQKAPVQ
ncbi:glycosyltransferase family 4 protein [Fulvivirga sedimenti]|uniref:Undecaprenyl/decaprenyl-phosphate alpha-N-acetylglucosaminyl 1-phosphate transferase n=1 Tax=Fulvivirga sedimenti TaxID=2879465 RepID=A0A9X1HV67_9BACT|nr:MraY family glycosyltransferase [Fulvivirga sedimenti]MCA6078266.1 undecaprenyl/decaprenyl-phosphate alpha-N-acetylglucosaminyl 1-phosphate transferase [Fulvivirga sedimenti]